MYSTLGLGYHIRRTLTFIHKRKYCKHPDKSEHIRKYIGKSGADIVFDKLLENNVKIVNGIIGGANLAIFDRFSAGRNGGKMPILLINNTNEQSTGYIAEGYGRISRQPGVAIITSGPGLTNIVTPLLDALSDAAPMIVISGQVSTTAPPNAFQHCEATQITSTCTKWNHKIQNVAEVPEVMDFAFKIAKHGRPGSVHIDFPKDLQSAILTENLVLDYRGLNSIIKENEKATFYSEKTYESSDINMDQIEEVLGLIHRSSRPVLYVGQGCNDYPSELLTFAKNFNIPVTTTVHALGVFDERQPLALKMLGMHGHATPNIMVQRADLILAIGSRFDDRTVGYLPYYAPVARQAEKDNTGGIIHVDIRQSENSKVVKPTHFIHADSGRFLQAINSASAKQNILVRSDWMSTMNNLKQKYPIQIPTYSDRSVSMQRVIQELDTQIEHIRDKCIITTGVGSHQMVVAQLITWSQPRQMVTSGSLGAMGSSLGLAMGAKLAAKDKTVISIDGDGSFNMSFPELITVMKLQLPIKIIIINNCSYVMAIHWQRLYCGNRLTASELENCDYNKLADAHNMKNLYCDDEKNLNSTMEEFIHFEGPILFNVKVTKYPCLPFVGPGRALDDMVFEDVVNDVLQNSGETGEVPG